MPDGSANYTFLLLTLLRLWHPDPTRTCYPYCCYQCLAVYRTAVPDAFTPACPHTFPCFIYARHSKKRKPFLVPIDIQHTLDDVRALNGLITLERYQLCRYKLLQYIYNIHRRHRLRTYGKSSKDSEVNAAPSVLDKKSRLHVQYEHDRPGRLQESKKTSTVCRLSRSLL